MDTLHIVLFSLLALASAAVVVLLIHGRKEIEIAVHKWAGAVATALAKAGFSSIVCDPFLALAAGDVDTAFADGAHLRDYLKDYHNWEKEILSVIRTALADPIMGPKVKKLFGDLLSGADAKTIQADADDVADSSQAKALTDANAQLADSVHAIMHSALHPDQAIAIAQLPDGQKHLAGLLVAGKALALAAVPAAPVPTVQTVPPGPVSAPTVANTAPTVAA
jgi:hypothetical protein